ncbi:EamA family transporter, partial [Bacillus mobilis]|uniref:EamA family transporter n=1 Tax=Bacillus mobilis TaxID=2026190 RepID=UPI00240E408E
LLVSVALVWGANYTIGKYGVAYMSSIQFNSLRFLVASPVLFILSIILTYTREYSHSVITSAILHGTFNVFYLTDGVETTWDISLMELIKFILLVIVFGMMYLIHRKVKK